MSDARGAPGKSGAWKHIKLLKWIIYPLLIVNLFFYVREESARAALVLDSTSTLFDWSVEYGSSISTLAFIVFLLMLELETNTFRAMSRARFSARLIRGFRLIAFVLIAHTVVSYGSSVSLYSQATPATGYSSLCQLANQDIDFVYNLVYTTIDEKNCHLLSDESELYFLRQGETLTTAAGVTIERALGWSDLIDVVVWILIMLSIELVIRLQDKKITTGATIGTVYKVKVVLYSMLFLLAALWGFLSHWLYIWDALLWVGGFVTIEMNINRWRDEIQAADNVLEPAQKV